MHEDFRFAQPQGKPCRAPKDRLPVFARNHGENCTTCGSRRKPFVSIYYRHIYWYWI